MPECLSCKEERDRKQLLPMQKVRLPLEVTAIGFRRPMVATWVCPHCDGETLVTSALRQNQQRQAE